MFEESNRIYDQLGVELPNNAITLHNVNGLCIPLSSQWTNIAINLSGGADSASLALVLCSLIKQHRYECKLHIITFIRCWNTRPWQEPIGTRMYNKLKELFPDIIGERYENYIPPELEWGATNGPILNGRSGDQIEGSSFNHYITTKRNINAVFNATSQNPLIENLPGRMLSRDKKAVDGTLADLIYRRGDRYFCHPYRFVQKDWIIAQFELLGYDELFEYTRSCEGDLGNRLINQKYTDVDHFFATYKPGDVIPECGECFWCLERNWAKNRIKNYTSQSDSI